MTRRVGAPAALALLLVLVSCAQVPTPAVGDAEPRVVTFTELSSWPYTDGTQGMPATVQQLSGQRVEIVGDLIPLTQREGLLVEKYRAPCAEGKDADIHGIVRVVLASGSTSPSVQRVRTVGVFHVEPTREQGYCVDIYQLHAELVEVVGR